MKVGFGYANSTFFPFWAMCHTYSPLCFLKQMPRREKIRGNFYENQTQILEEIAAKIAQKLNTQNKLFGGKYCENRTF